jgi:D-arabinose 1-dehydrogenase-like Zn-dependent alcohol dehydrogenase
MSEMRAMAIGQRGGRFQLQSPALPPPSGREVRLRVQACGVCHSDALVVQGGAMPGLDYPRIPGHEVIGTIDAVGDQVQGWSVGERAGVGWFSGACGYCRECERGNAFACENVRGATGVTRDGGYATHMLALASGLVQPDERRQIHE